jgi:hypothetical protein
MAKLYDKVTIFPSKNDLISSSAKERERGAGVCWIRISEKIFKISFFYAILNCVRQIKTIFPGTSHVKNFTKKIMVTK